MMLPNILLPPLRRKTRAGEHWRYEKDEFILTLG